jgi:hypothetical protein
MGNYVNFIEISSDIYLIDSSNVYVTDEYVDSEFVRDSLNNKKLKVRILDRKNEEIWKNFSDYENKRRWIE